MTKNILTITLCLTCLEACKPPTAETAEEVAIIDVDRALRSGTKNLRISDFADSITFIPIFDGNSAYIGDPLRMEMTSDHLFVYDMTDRLVCYDFRDRTSRQIGRRGRGPQEYIRIEDIAADEERDIIYALVRNDPTGNSHIFKYDFEGRFLDDFPLDGDAYKIGLSGDGDLVVHFTNYFGNAKNQYAVMDHEGNPVTDYPNPFPYELSGGRHTFMGESAKYSYGGEFNIKDKSDTLYVFRDKGRHPRYVFKNSFSIDGRPDLTHAEYDNAFVLNYVFETNTKLMFNGHIGEPSAWRYFYYDKTTKQTHSIESQIRNDLTDSPEFFRQITADTTFGDCYVKITGNPQREGDPPIEEAAHFLMLLHLK
ncbi:MAG: 6-bladed beta-propeller [Alistipes sp.]|nr:6-bladed beta-propeller [Alistipes sp.]